MSELGTVISCFDLSCNMVRPWARAGYTCICVDIQHPGVCPMDGAIIRMRHDVLTWEPPRIPIAIAFFAPPCTDVAVSGARWFRQKGLGALIQALRLFDASIRIAEACGAPWMIENPVSTVSTYWRKPDYIFQPWQYGDMYSKKTCLWTGGGFKMPQPQYVEKPEGVDERIWRMPPSPDRAQKRSITPAGFAQAVFEANSP